ncbi:fumarylacetoacetate hydrolase family protein [Pseudomonas citronellolis]|uniref:fumarylacetoacetate hydrolase family protein n=1 Tax=Pseudomonas citronellolis TaxID=53408 RepID=UPI0020A15DEA|nr:fumarylacetoacetate hydrolase family protein [Pseudomonas citronellolis]MCP1603150.1 2-keto-4-pentenoate hydratase/2-oxohepta-3-ene-1,7-dioic acid hydratase in catechol pathway [Pseudomonas citronellolis]MCP1654208.1 2-keto-4-pentenoate hydratase/2-oxohepta-3-ene-1,7-dioic acid hydratase in catechol pathway [Pseudomonas citronellolis]MCP1720895.1 2-keto-4-pentenoate hydratase/2-oxohepta-3-ene-1,7-dioic acid hydratase in catechol pathway [Pseudomonas citronellolis]
MKLCTFKTPGGLVGVGIVNGDGIIRVADHLSAAPRDMAGLIGEWQLWQEPLQRLAQIQKADFVLDEVTLLAPLPRPGKILGIGLNYADHVAESGMATPADQLWFAMMNTAANGPYAPIDLPLVSEQLDYEAEMVFVIGKRCRHVSREQARDAIFGYCVGNDVSVRDWQLRTSQFVLGKSFDGHAPFGPWLVTPDEVGNPHELGIRCFVNDEKRQESNTRELIFDCYQQVEHLSKVMTLEPGDVIFSGTPGGVGAGFKPPRWLREGDRVRVEIDGLGAIQNTVRAERVGDEHAH